MTKISDSIVGLVPAAGTASRLGRLPFSKELLPLGRADGVAPDEPLPVAIENAITSLVENGVTRQHVIIAHGKWDIPAYLGDGRELNADISYLVANASPSVPHSLDAAYSFVGRNDVVLVFPDIVFQPRSAISELVAQRGSSDTDVALVLVPSTRGDKVDMVTSDDEGNVSEIRAKPGPGQDGWTWVAAQWAGAFTEFLHVYLQQHVEDNRSRAGTELYVADVLNAALREGLKIRALKFADGDAIDIGTIDDLAHLWQRNA